METIILSPPDKKLQYIIHVSDIHIRTGDLDKSRYIEYGDVFKNLIDSISKLESLDESVLVITGDIFHHKGKIEPAGIKLAQSLLTSLLEYTDVFMICGNHDYRQDNPAIPDMIETIYENYINKTIKTKYRAFYLNKTGYYHYHNIGFAVVDIKDTLKTYNTFGRNEDLISFPSKTVLDTHDHIDYAIALFHGTILPSRLANNLNIKTGYELEWFDTYEYVMLGDNHRTQWNNDDGKLWAYSGSLIQQDFGETFMEHGYLYWTLPTKHIQFKNVFNNYGHCTVKETKSILYAVINKKTSIELANFPTFPKNVAFRVFSKDLIPKVEKFCALNNITPSCIIHWSSNDTDATADADTTDTDATIDTTADLQQIEALNTTEKWFEYLGKHTDIDTIKPFILHPELLKLPMIEQTIDFFKKYTERNDKIQKVIDEYICETMKVHKSAERVELLNMSWAYLMCYGEHNYFDFKSLNNSIALLNGKNAMGKSSFLDVICIALYGEPTKMRHLVNGKKYSDKIIHDQRPINKTSPFVKVLFQIGSNRYEIYRSFGTQSAKAKEHLIVQTNIQIYKVTTLALKTLICEGSTLVDRWIEDNIGNMESILMSIMICQTDLNNFFHLKQDEQKMILDKALRLDTVSLYGRILKEATLAHNDILQQIKTAKQTVETMFPVAYVSKKGEIDTELYTLETTLTDKRVWRNDILKQVNRIYKANEIEVNIDFAFDEVQTAYIHTNMNTPISCEDKTLMIVAREKLLAIDEELNAAFIDVELIDSDEKNYKKWIAKYERFLTKEPKCNVKMDWIKHTLNNYNEWSDNKTAYNLEEIEKDFNKIEATVLNFVKIEKPLIIPKNKFIDVCTLTEKDFLKKINIRKDLLETPLNKNRTIEEYNKWLKTYQTWSHRVESVVNIDISEITDKRQCLVEKIQIFNDALKEKEQLEEDLCDVKDLEFNHECWACKKNPFALKKAKLTAKYEAIKNEIIQTELISKWEVSIAEYDSTIVLYNEYALKKDAYANEVIYWNDILKSWKDYDKWKTTIDSLTTEIDEYENYKAYRLYKDYKDQEETHKSLLLKYKEIKDLYDMAKKYAYEEKEWESVLEEIEKYNDIYKLYEIWEEEHVIIKDRLTLYDNSMKKRKLEELRAVHESEYNLRKKNADSYQRYEDTKNMYYSNKLHIVDTEIADLNAKREVCLTEKAKVDASDEIIKKHKTTFEKLLCLEHTYEERIVKIKNLDLLFMGDKTVSDGYKEWIYKTQVIPLINKEMNNFLGMFETFAFNMSYEKKHFIYMLEDRGNKPTLDKASGYQNFIIGLAFRIILTRIGCIGQQMKHLFIDEGFTACDSANIEKVPSMLKSILKYGDYESIMLMSHLDSVRECTSIHINIERRDPFSYIHHGALYPEISIFNEDTGDVIKQKGRGRPTKKVTTD